MGEGMTLAKSAYYSENDTSCKKNFLADMLVNFFLLDKVTLLEYGTTKKLCITFLLRLG